MASFSKILLPLVAVLVLAGCKAGPDYRRPEQALPQHYAALEGWKQASPGQVDTQQWWLGYQDQVLDTLLVQLDEGNQNLAAAEAAWQEAAAALGATRAGLYPELTGKGGDSRSAQGRGDVVKSRNVQLGLSWQLDIWGQIRRQVEAGAAQLDASAADQAALRLSLQSQLVQSYVQLRSLDEQLRIARDNVNSYQRVLNISEHRYQAGMVSRSDVNQALSQLRSAQAQMVDLGAQRERNRHALALLLGEPASSFELPAVAGLPQLPAVPEEVPSSLLERRPDIAAAEQRMIAANAGIGVAKTAYFPSFSLGASGGYSSADWSGLISTPNRFWSLGPQFDLRLFDAGARRAKTRQAQAAYDQQVARYRQTVLEAVVEVEDALVQLQALAVEQLLLEEALKAARDAQQQVEDQYAAGMVDYLSVSSALVSAHAAERSLLASQASRLQATAQLAAALGGGWQGL